MSNDDSEVDSGVDAGDVTDVPTDGETTTEQPASGPREGFGAQLSVPSRRAYGVERTAATDDEGGLLTPRQRQYLRQAERLNQSDREAVQDAVSERVGEFVDTDWPVICEGCPEVAAALREEVCEGSD
jgi:uncharacterized membrane protein